MFSGLGDLVIIALATWRAAELIGVERGPWAVFERIRARAGVVVEHGEPVAWPHESEIAWWIACIYCRTVALAGVVLLAWRYARPVVWLLAASAGALAFNRGIHGGASKS